MFEISFLVKIQDYSTKKNPHLFKAFTSTPNIIFFFVIIVIILHLYENRPCKQRNKSLGENNLTCVCSHLRIENII